MAVATNTTMLSLTAKPQVFTDENHLYELHW